MNEIQIYSTDKGTEIRVKLDNETIWLSQRQMAELFERDTDTISLHLKNIYAENELEESSTTVLPSLVQKKGSRMVNSLNNYYFQNIKTCNDT